MIIVLLVLIVVAMAVCTVLIIGALDNCTDRIVNAVSAKGKVPLRPDARDGTTLEDLARALAAFESGKKPDVIP